MFLLFLFVSIETFGYCYLGTQLSQEVCTVALKFTLLQLCFAFSSSQSINIGQALYASGWYEYDVQMRKYISFMIMRSQRRVGLTAAKFCFVDMEQFGAVCAISL